MYVAAPNTPTITYANVQALDESSIYLEWVNDLDGQGRCADAISTVYQNGTLLADSENNSTGTSLTATGLLAGTAYYYTVSSTKFNQTSPQSAQMQLCTCKLSQNNNLQDVHIVCYEHHGNQNKECAVYFKKKIVYANRLHIMR